MNKWLLTVLLSSAALYACTNITEQNSSAPTIETPAMEDVTSTKAGILHDITIEESGRLKITRAYLTFEDGGLVPKSNKILLGDKVYLNLVFDKSNLPNKTKVAINASQEIVTNKGELVTDTPHLFKDSTFIDTNNHDRVYLQATIITTRPDIDHFVVHYHVWDINGKGELRGSYKIYIDDAND